MIIYDLLLATDAISYRTKMMMLKLGRLRCSAGTFLLKSGLYMNPSDLDRSRISHDKIVGYAINMNTIIVSVKVRMMTWYEADKLYEHEVRLPTLAEASGINVSQLKKDFDKIGMGNCSLVDVIESGGLIWTSYNGLKDGLHGSTKCVAYGSHGECLVHNVKKSESYYTVPFYKAMI